MKMKMKMPGRTMMHLIILFNWMGAMGRTIFAPHPHVVFVLVDDFGHGNVGYNNAWMKNGEVETPVMDRLAQKQGRILHRHYVHPACTPSRSSFQSGRLPVHVARFLSPPCARNSGVPANMTGIAEKLSEKYSTHFVGKWDCGMAREKQIPKGRGYNSSLLYFGHGNWMWSENEWQGSYRDREEIPECIAPKCLRDFWDDDRPAKELQGTKFEEWLFRERIDQVFDSRDWTEKRMFLVYASRLAHYPLQVPIEYERRFEFIEEPHRRVYAAMINLLDEQIGYLEAKLLKYNMWDETLFVLSSDNGGYTKEVLPCSRDDQGGTVCMNGESGGNNYPLRGGKYSFFEGGIRGNAFVSGGFLPKRVWGRHVEHEIIHIADWYTTFTNLAGISSVDVVDPPVDGLDMWPLLSGETDESPRKEVLLEENAFLKGRYKLLLGHQQGAGWSGPFYPNASSPGHEIGFVTLDCGTSGCLFDVVKDPTEHEDIAKEYPNITKALRERLLQERKSIWSLPTESEDPMCREMAMKKWDGFLGPFLF